MLLVLGKKTYLWSKLMDKKQEQNSLDTLGKRVGKRTDIYKKAK